MEEKPEVELEEEELEEEDEQSEGIMALAGVAGFISLAVGAWQLYVSGGSGGGAIIGGFLVLLGIAGIAKGIVDVVRNR